MKIRTTKPEKGNKFYNTTSNGGYSLCITGYPKDSGCDVLSNCVGYACGRFNEIIGSMKYPYLNCNAENFIERAKSYGLKISSKPSLGGIMVWQKGSTLSGSDGAGHVEVVERIDGTNSIYTSSSAYGGSAFYNVNRTNSNGRWGMSSSYKFRGCIINPKIGTKTTPDKKTTTKTVDEIAKEVIAGKWGNGQARINKLTAAGYNYKTVQSRVDKILAGKNTTSTPKKSLDDIAGEVLIGKWGNGEERIKALKEAGYDPLQVQARVNALVYKK
jgi:surface antigen